MGIKKHYDQHLAHFYSWMLNDFTGMKDDFAAFCQRQEIRADSGVAIDLGAGSGVQSIALAELGFRVLALDFSTLLLDELSARRAELPIEIINEDIRNVLNYRARNPELIVCCGDTLPHLESLGEIDQLISDGYESLVPGGKMVLSFRDYSSELSGISRFLPVKSDEQRILTCFLEYFPDKLRVTDLLHERTDGEWQLRASSYDKVRVSPAGILEIMANRGFETINREDRQRMVYLVGQKPG